MKMKDLYDEIEVPAGLESRLESLIDTLARNEKRSKRKIRQLRLWTGCVAATLFLLLSTGLFLKSGLNPFNGGSAIQPVENPEIAYQETQKALELVSRNFNKGLDQLTVVNKEIEKSNQIINKALKK
jgi:hypothetical protein